MCGSMADIQSAAAEIRRGIKKIDRKKPQGKNIMSACATQGGHNKADRRAPQTHGFTSAPLGGATLDLESKFSALATPRSATRAVAELFFGFRHLHAGVTGPSFRPC